MGPLRLTAAAVAVACLAAGCTPSDDGATPGSSSTNDATVDWVTDGDTVRLTNGRKVRLVQVDAPEHAKDCYGRKATKALVSLVPKGTHITLERDAALDDTDPYDRLLRTIFVGDVNINLALVRQGAAAPYFFRNQRGRYAGELLAAAKAARAERRGFWGSCPRAQLNTGLGSVTGPAATEHR